VTSRNWGMPPENNYYNEVILNDPTLTLDNPVAGHEIQIIVGRPSKVARGFFRSGQGDKIRSEHTYLDRQTVAEQPGLKAK
jgi:hypothetical protein